MPAISTFPNTGSSIQRGTGSTTEGRTSTGLSTQIIIRVNSVAVGALQKLSVNQGRGLVRITEIGTDGCVEIVPKEATTFELTAERIVFDQLRLPEAFSRSFRFINAQRIPFDIEVYDTSASSMDGGNAIIMKYVNCWFTSYDTPYAADNYVITETAKIWAETGYVVDGNLPAALRDTDKQTDTNSIELQVNKGLARGGLDTAGIVNAIFGTPT